MSDTPAPKKVLFFQHSEMNGGAPRSLKQIVKAYEAEFGPQTVLFIRPGPVLKTYEDVTSTIKCGRYILPFHGSEVSGMHWKHAVRNLAGLLAVPGTYWRFLRGYDVLYLNSSALCMHGLFARLFAPRRTRIIYHIREPLLANIWGRTIRACVGWSANYVMAISKNELKDLRLPDMPGEVVYNYVHSDEYQPERGQSLHRQDPAVGPDKLTIGYFARVDEKNGIGDFLHVAKRLEDRSDIAFVIYGYTGQEVRSVREMIAHVGPNVHVYPMVSDVPTNLGDLDLLLVPFRSPHFSRSTIEAAMLRVPSVIYDIASVNETVKDGETGYVVPLGDVTAMGDAVARLAADPETRARLAEGAHAFAMESFSERNYLRIRGAIHAA